MVFVSEMVDMILLLFNFLTFTKIVICEDFPLRENNLLAGALGTKSPPPKPSIRLSDEQESKVTRMRKDYGGKGDKLHLGGFRVKDYSSRSNNTWNFMLGHIGIKSLVDVGCGVGISTEYFLNNGARVLCVEGSHDAVEKTKLPINMVVEHDFTRGAYWPNQTFDAAWSVEFVEHVGRQFHSHYIPTFRRAALVFMTASSFGGWHHSEIRPSWWWISRMEIAGFKYSNELTNLVRANARSDYALSRVFHGYGSYIAQNMMVFVNIALASRPEFDHLMSGHGCKWSNEMVPCDKRFKWYNKDVDVPPAKYQALLDCVHADSRNTKAPSRNKDWASGPWRCSRNPDAVAN